MPFELRQYPLASHADELLQHRCLVLIGIYNSIQSAHVCKRLELSQVMALAVNARRQVIRRIDEGKPSASNETPEWLRYADWTQEQIYCRVIFNLMNSVSSIFLLCLSHHWGVSPLVDVFREEAIDKYLEHPNAYDKVYGDFLPAEFRAEERARLDQGKNLRQYRAWPIRR